MRVGRFWWGMWLAVVLVSPRAQAADPHWQEHYEQARRLLLEDKVEAASREFEQLAKDAPSEVDRKVAEEMASVARERALAKRIPVDTKARTSDEMSILYTSAFIYGIGSGAWVALQTEPQSFATAVVPFVTLTTAAVGGVAIADDYRPLRLGVPQAISAGMYLGLGEGVWLVGYQHAGASRRDDDSHWGARTVSTVLWSGATLGAIAGGAVGSLRQPTPGGIAFTASTTIWGGLVSAFTGAALDPDEEGRRQTAFFTGVLGYNLGLAGGLLLSPIVDVSKARVRFVDLGGVAGGLIGASAYFLAAGERTGTRGGLVAGSAGALAGLGLTWWFTDDMESGSEPDQDSLFQNTRLLLAPTASGWIAGVSGTL